MSETKDKTGKKETIEFESKLEKEVKEKIEKVVSGGSSDENDREEPDNRFTQALEKSVSDDKIKEVAGKGAVFGAQSDQLTQALEKADEFENKYLRAHAEMQNIQRRVNEERENLRKYRSQDLAKKILPSLDNLERALQIESLTDDVKKGLEMVRESLIIAFKEEGIREVAVETFDPNVHMAVQTIPADAHHPPDSIAEVLQKGYQLHERLIRPAMVVIYN